MLLSLFLGQIYIITLYRVIQIQIVFEVAVCYKRAPTQERRSLKPQ